MDSLGRSPSLWADRSAVFFANILSMFFGNEEETELLRQETYYPESYGGRLIPILGLLFGGGRSLLVLERPADSGLCRYFSEDLGLQLPEIGVFSHSRYLALGTALMEGRPHQEEPFLNQLRQHSARFVDGYVTDRTLEVIAQAAGKRTISPMTGSRRGNNKLLLHQHLEREGLPVFDTILVEGAAEVPAALAALAGRGYEAAVLKSPIGASGVGMMKLQTAAGQTQPIPQLLFNNGLCMVQGWLAPGCHGVTAVHSPSVQLFIGEDRILLYDLTEQILSHESVHEGNESPPPYLGQFPGLKDELLRQAAVAARWLHSQQYRGTASADFLVVEKHEPPGFNVYVCELNARVTGATYPSLLARHFLPQGAWLMRNLKLAKPEPGALILDLLRQRGDLYQPGRARGILPINFNLDPDNLVVKGQFLCLDSESCACHDMLTRAEMDLPIDWSYVRD